MKFDTKGFLIGMLVVVPGLALLMRGRRAQAAPAPAPSPEGSDMGTRNWATFYGREVPMPRADVEAGIAQAIAESDADWTGSERLYQSNRAAFDAHPVPLPPRVVGAVMSRESGGRDVDSGWGGETGPLQLTPGEVEMAGGGNPHDMKDAIRMAQILYGKAIAVMPQADARNQTTVALLSRSIGIGATRWLMTKFPPSAEPLPDRIEAWLRGTPTKPVKIRQSPQKFALRIYRAAMRADTAHTLGYIPQSGKLPGT